MGEYRHIFATIIVGTDEDLELVHKAAQKAKVATCLPVRTSHNSMWVVHTVPSGSKRGWGRYQDHLRDLKNFIESLTVGEILYVEAGYGPCNVLLQNKKVIVERIEFELRQCDPLGRCSEEQL